ncbi:UpxY family transcription antiterminator [Aequorivita sp. H23M31]|uniref:UpxY family transcription antiterminator n=1 Tax=Aequorivita ciconiae TaxID=2494375 RepID=A0A410G3I2_9FLAO|nr:UpxY family transcription antiterminator [Aequorivita sp. H23M31]QAA81826.1 UpxY family transcription antiterminator [Aequorivita sp. H23M31]
MKNCLYPQWFVLYVRYRYEKKVAFLLEEKNIKVFSPFVDSMSIWSDRKKKIQKPLFPNYVFVWINSMIDFYTALSLEGVVKYVRFGADYAHVQEKEIVQIKQILDIADISEIDLTSVLPCQGTEMKINYGPLQGFDCIVLKADRRRKILVKVESIQHYITACVPESYLSPR